MFQIRRKVTKKIPPTQALLQKIINFPLSRTRRPFARTPYTPSTHLPESSPNALQTPFSLYPPRDHIQTITIQTRQKDGKRTAKRRKKDEKKKRRLRRYKPTPRCLCTKAPPTRDCPAGKTLPYPFYPKTN